MKQITDVADPQQTEEALAESLAERISAQLSMHNWTMKMLSDKSDIPYETIKKIAHGRVQNPSLRSILQIALALGCPLDYLAGRG